MEIFENLSASSRLQSDELDAYSRAVREVTERLGPAVISVGTRSGRGGGSGVILGSDGSTATAVTNSHVARGLRRAGGDLRVTLADAINPGNSGGPLADTQQRVVGINTAIIGGAQGIGFAVPVSAAFRRVVFALVTEGRVRRAFLGVMMQSRQARGGSSGGAQVESIASNGPAERAGVRPGDVIVGFGEGPVRSTDDLLNLLDESAIGRDTELRVRRGKRELTMNVRPQEQPTD
ncbi:MAG: PDZ domain-containing protein [Actinobacteria bacterium]|nr:PDZ domain-containing protein [Actinomycetota bacterium]